MKKLDLIMDVLQGHGIDGLALTGIASFIKSLGIGQLYLLQIVYQQDMENALQDLLKGENPKAEFPLEGFASKVSLENFAKQLKDSERETLLLVLQEDLPIDKIIGSILSRYTYLR